MTLKNPSDLFNFKKPVHNEEFMVEAASDSIMSLYETFDRFSSFDRLKGNINKIEEISNTLSTLKENISDKVSKSELDAAIFSQLMVMDEIFKKIQSQIKGLNKEDLDEYSSHINGLTEYVKEFTEVEIPKYKKQVLSTELRFSEKLESYQKIIEDELSSSDEKLNSQLNNVAEVIDEQLNSFSTQIQETKNEVLKTSDTYTKLYKIIESKGVKENERLDEYNNILENFNEQLDKFNVEFSEFQQLAQESINSHITKLQENVDSISNSLDEKFNEYDSHLNEFVLEIESDFDTLKSGLSKKFTDIETDVVKVEKHLKDTNSNLSKVEEYIKENHNELISLREEVYSDVSKLPVGNIWENIERLDNKINQIKEAYSKIEPEVIIKQVITEGGFAEPSSAKNSDPLTPLNQNFVTLPQLQQHYRLFLNRIQEQISTIGGGGETQLKYLDDIVGIATNPSAYDGNFLRYNHTLRKFEFVEVASGPNNGTVNYAPNAGIATNVIGGIGSITSLSVSGISTLGTVQISSGIITATLGVVTYYGDGSKLTGITATYATSSGIATYAPNAGIASALTSTASVNTSGIITASSFVGNLTGTANTATFSTSSGYATTAGISTVARGLTGNPSISVTNLSASGISTLGTVRISSGIITASSGVVTYFGDGGNLTGVATTSHQATHRLGGTDVITPAVQTMGDADATVSATFTIVGTSVTFTAPRTLTLPAASTVPSGLSINIIDTFGAINGGNTLIIQRTGTDTINGGTSISMGAPRSSRQLISNGLNAWSFDAGVLRSSNNLSDVISPSEARTNIGARAPQINIFTSSGTWTKPAGAVSVNIQLMGGGGGGGSGRKDSTTNTGRSGGGGGGGGSLINMTVPASALEAEVSVTIGAGGAGAIGQGNSGSNGFFGTSGGTTSFGTTALNTILAPGGGAGNPGTASGGAAGAAFLFANPGGAAGSSGAAGAFGAPTSTFSVFLPGGAGGAGGGGVNTSNVATAGGGGGRSNLLNFIGGAAGTAGTEGGDGGAGITNTLAELGLLIPGSGGGSGGGGTTGSGGAGGAGGFPGSGGGGGGGTSTGATSATSGAGGAGAAGMAIITTYF